MEVRSTLRVVPIDKPEKRPQPRSAGVRQARAASRQALVDLHDWQMRSPGHELVKPEPHIRQLRRFFS